MVLSAKPVFLFRTLRTNSPANTFPLFSTIMQLPLCKFQLYSVRLASFFFFPFFLGFFGVTTTNGRVGFLSRVEAEIVAPAHTNCVDVIRAFREVQKAEKEITGGKITLDLARKSRAGSVKS